MRPFLRSRPIFTAPPRPVPLHVAKRRAPVVVTAREAAAAVPAVSPAAIARAVDAALPQLTALTLAARVVCEAEAAERAALTAARSAAASARADAERDERAAMKLQAEAEHARKVAVAAGLLTEEDYATCNACGAETHGSPEAVTQFIADHVCPA